MLSDTIIAIAAIIPLIAKTSALMMLFDQFSYEKAQTSRSMLARPRWSTEVLFYDKNVTQNSFKRNPQSQYYISTYWLSIHIYILYIFTSVIVKSHHKHLKWESVLRLCTHCIPFRLFWDRFSILLSIIITLISELATRYQTDCGLKMEL